MKKASRKANLFTLKKYYYKVVQFNEKQQNFQGLLRVFSYFFFYCSIYTGNVPLIKKYKSKKELLLISKN